MSKLPMPQKLQVLRSELESHVVNRTGGRIRKLDIQLSPGRVVLSGLAASFYVKQLAQQGVSEFLPGVCLENAIQVVS
jgi:hypothetical protein